jgi:Arylsulfotransferase (ASST)
MVTFDPALLPPVGDERTTRAGFLRCASGSALGLSLLGGVGLDGVRLLRAADAEAAAPRSPNDVRRFHSRPDLRPQRLTILRSAGLLDDCLFLAPSSGPGQRGVLILDGSGDVVWFHSTTPLTAMNFRTALFKGKPVLTWWEGRAERGLGRGKFIVMDSTYRVIARLPAAGRRFDLHEFELTPRGTALVTSHVVRPANLSSVGGPARGKVIGSVVQEIAIPSGRVLFEWRSLEHVPIEESYAAYTGHAYDYFHINSVDVDADGNLLLSARNTWAVYKVHRETGKVLWRLGGKRSDFRMGAGTAFAWQHDARHHNEGRLISIFDNAAEPPVRAKSRVLVIALDRRARYARLVREYAHPRQLLAPFMGNAQLLRNGNVVVGWGALPYITEFHRNGEVRFDARLPAGGMNYRAFRFPWLGRPQEPPRLVSHTEAGRRALYTSWNGATEVVRWRLEAGPRPDDLEPVLTKPKQGFETSLPVPPGGRFGVAVALDAQGRVLGRSNALRL